MSDEQDLLRAQLAEWLHKAHSLERGLLPVLELQIQRAEEHPELQVKLTQHLEASRRQMHAVEGRLRELQIPVPIDSTGLHRFFERSRSLVQVLAEEDLVENLAAELAIESFEMSLYQAIAEAATLIGDERTADLCRKIFDEEHEMSAWLAQNMAEIVRDHLASLTAGDEVDRD